MAAFGWNVDCHDCGHGGESLAAGFLRRKADLSVCILPNHADFFSLLARRGPHRLRNACRYPKRSSDVDDGALHDLFRAGLDDLSKRWPVHPV